MKSLTVATLNLKRGKSRWGERAPLLVQQLVELRPDVIGFQEVDISIDQGNWIRSRFNDLLWGEGAPEYRIHHMANPRERVSLEGLAIMTHLPVVEHEGYDYLIRNRAAHRVRLDLGDGVVLDLWNTHFHHEQDPAGMEMRQQQVERLLGWLDKHSAGTPKVVSGDFNAFPATAVVQRLKERLRSTYEAVHGEEPADTIWTPLRVAEVGWRPRVGMVVDYIFVSEGVKVVDARRAFDREHPEDGTLSASDHFGLVTTIEVG